LQGRNKKPSRHKLKFSILVITGKANTFHTEKKKPENRLSEKREVQYSYMAVEG
jgi:hypothetical protein